MLQAAFYYKSVLISFLLLLAPPQSAISCMFTFESLLVFVMYCRQNQSYPLWLASLCTEGSNNDWTALLHSQLYAESFHRPKKAHTSLSLCYLLPYSRVLLPALPGKREILFSGFSAFTLFIGSLTLMRIDKGYLSFLWVLRKTHGIKKTIIIVLHYIRQAF